VLQGTRYAPAVPSRFEEGKAVFLISLGTGKVTSSRALPCDYCQVQQVFPNDGISFPSSWEVRSSSPLPTPPAFGQGFSSSPRRDKMFSFLLPSHKNLRGLPALLVARAGRLFAVVELFFLRSAKPQYLLVFFRGPARRRPFFFFR